MLYLVGSEHLVNPSEPSMKADIQSKAMNIIHEENVD